MQQASTRIHSPDVTYLAANRKEQQKSLAGLAAIASVVPGTQYSSSAPNAGV